MTKRDTKLIVASDGLWDIVAGDKAFRLIKEEKAPLEAAKRLCATAVKSRKCHDNVTVIVIHLRPEKKVGSSVTPEKKTSSSRTKSGITSTTTSTTDPSKPRRTATRENTRERG